MTRLGWFECLVLVFFGLSAFAAFLTGGMVWVGYVAQVFLWTSILWLGRGVAVEYWQDLKERQTKRLNGME